MAALPVVGGLRDGDAVSDHDVGVVHHQPTPRLYSRDQFNVVVLELILRNIYSIQSRPSLTISPLLLQVIVSIFLSRGEFKISVILIIGQVEWYPHVHEENVELLSF